MSDLLYAVAARVPADAAERIGAELFQLGASGVEEQASGRHTELVTYWSSAREQAAFVVRVNELRERIPEQVDAVRSFAVPDASQAWLQYLRPERLTERFWVLPDGMRFTEGQGETITLLVRSAFGFGEHVTTRLAAREVERRVREDGARDVLDVGTGTGILCLVATLSGARRAVGLDCDEVAVAVARDNARINAVAERCHFLLSAQPPGVGAYDIVVCNIATPYLQEHAAQLCDRLAPNGSLVLSGFLKGDTEALASQFASLGMVVKCRMSEAGWGLLALTRSAGAR